RIHHAPPGSNHHGHRPDRFLTRALPDFHNTTTWAPAYLQSVPISGDPVSLRPLPVIIAALISPCLSVVAIVFPWLAGAAVAADTQPEAPKNLKYFSKDIAKPDLISKMRQFSFALGVPCTHCHGTKEQVGFDLQGVDFSTDLKPTKNKARAMLRMT